jgi:hypothetical protein
MIVELLTARFKGIGNKRFNDIEVRGLASSR